MRGAPAAIGFPPDDQPPPHTPTFRHPETPEGHAYCLRCQRFVTFETMTEACGGKDSA